METYIIKEEKDLERFKDDYGYYVDGNLEIEFDLNINGILLVTGYIKAGWYIEVGGYIKAGEYIEVGGYIKAGEYIEAGGYIEAGEYIEAGGYIEAGEYIKVGEYYGIIAGLQISCKGTLSFGLRCFAGTCSWRKINDEEKTITCSKLVGKGIIAYGILKEIGEVNNDSNEVEESINLLKKKNG